MRTNFIRMIRCIECFRVQEPRDNCVQCGFLFIREATSEEKVAANDRLVLLQEKKEE